MSDRTVTILHLLAAAARLGDPPVGRTAIVKQTYLVEMLRPSYELWTRAFEFVRFHYGPYNKDIFQRLNQLIFHGLVEVTEFNVSGRTVRATYTATESGLTLSEKILRIPENQYLASLCEDVVWSLQCLGFRSATDMIRLVYREPSYAQVALRSVQEGLSDSEEVDLPNVHSAQHPSFRLQAVLFAIRRFRNREPVFPRDIVRSYLQYLTLSMFRTEREPEGAK